MKYISNIPKFRGRGIAKAILTELEKWALELEYRKTILETGYKQVAAIDLYRHTGYVQMENYGLYAEIPISICFKKILFKL